MRLAPLFLLAASTLSAHDFWIQPSAHRVAPGSLIRIRLMVGEGHKGEALTRNPERFARFASLGPAGDLPLIGMDGADPAGFLRPAAPGLQVIYYAGKPSKVELGAAKFEAYLREEGLESIHDLRMALGETAQPGRERFIRCAKSLVQVGGAREGYDRVLGLKLELVPEADPFEGAGELPLRLLHEGRPQGGVLVVAVPEGGGAPVKARTDAEGRVRLDLPATGRWMVKAVHMRRLEGQPDADWESLWASLSFERP